MSDQVLTPICGLALVVALCTGAPLVVAGSCDSGDIQRDISCLKRLGISIDQFTEEYLQWVSDLQAELTALNQEAARCSILRLRYEEDQSLNVLKQIQLRCEGDWLEDRLRRFNAIREDYLVTKARYQQIREYYDTAKELLGLIESRQARLEREYAQSRRTAP